MSSTPPPTAIDEAPGLSLDPSASADLGAALLQAARGAAARAHAPYSHFRVGAAVLAGRRVFVGCNVENASYGLSVCAERVAIFKAISEGAGPFQALAVACVDAAPTVKPGVGPAAVVAKPAGLPRIERAGGAAQAESLRAGVQATPRGGPGSAESATRQRLGPLSALRMPCGACRQVMAEFGGPDFPVWVDGVGRFRLDELLPSAFRLPSE